MSEPLESAVAVAAPADSAEIMKLKNDRALAEFASPFTSAAAYRHFMTVANIFAESVFVPAHFKGKPGECLIAIDIARRMNEGELMVMQQMFVVKGNPGFKTKFMIARANRLAGFKSTIKWRRDDLGAPLEVKNDKGTYPIPNMRVTAYAVDRFGELIEASVDTTMAIAEGWTTNEKYRSMPEHMFRWRSASFLINLYAPEVMMGMETVEELETREDLPSERNITPPVPASAGGGVQVLESRVAALAAAPSTAAERDRVTIEKAVEESGPARVTLAPDAVAQLRAKASALGVAWSAVEEHFGGPIEEYSEIGKDDMDLWEAVETTITVISHRAEKARSEAEPSGSLFDDGAGKGGKKASKA